MTGPDEPPSRTLEIDSAARLLSELVVLVAGVAGAVITARWLGPAGKGISANLIFLGSLFGRLAALGLGDAAVILVGKRRVDQATAVAGNLAAVLLAGAAAGAISVLVAHAQVDPSSPELTAAVALTGIAVVLIAIGDTMSHAVTMQAKIVEASKVIALVSVVTLLAIVVFVVIFDLGVLGASLAGTVAGVAGIIGAARYLGDEISLRPRWKSAYLREVLPYGLRLEVSTMLAMVAGRVDLLFVFSIAGAGAAGNYSVALTLASIAGLAPFALSYASFPRLAYSEEGRAEDLTIRIQRMSIAAAGLAALGLAAITPLAVPFAFGEDFSDAVVPALILLAGAVPAAAQWSLARALAARGDTNLLVYSFLLASVVMVALDLILIDPFGLTGAAVASTAGALAGFSLCVHRFRRAGGSARALLPRPADVVFLVRSALTAPARIILPALRRR